MKGARKATLVDVAERAGVSTTTVSYILNGRSAEMRISPDTERRVRDAVADLGYRPNRNARNLRTSSTSTIGLISDFVASGQFASQMLTGASAAARRSDHLLVIGETGGDPEVEALLIDEMLERQVDGIIYATVVSSEIVVPPQLAQREVVLLNCVDPASGLTSILPDELEGGRSAAAAVLDTGVEGEVWVVGEDPTPNAIAGELRLEGVRTGLAEARRTLAGVVSCEWSVREAFRTVSGWLAAGARPAALVCLNDRIGMGVYQALGAHGLEVPRDVVVVSFDGSELATWLRPELTSVALPFVQLGALAVDTVLDPGRATGAVLRVPMPLSIGGSAPVAPTPRRRRVARRKTGKVRARA